MIMLIDSTITVHFFHGDALINKVYPYFNNDERVLFKEISDISEVKDAASNLIVYPGSAEDVPYLSSARIILDGSKPAPFLPLSVIDYFDPDLDVNSCVYYFARDIGWARQAVELAGVRAELVYFIEKAPFPVIMLDKNWNVVRFSQVIAPIVKKTKQEIEMMNYFAWKKENFVEVPKDIPTKLFEHGPIFRFDDGDGEVAYVEEILSELYDSQDNLIGYYVVFNDVTSFVEAGQ